MDTCRASCIDAEAAYGVKSSAARTRFNHEYNELRRELEDAGLWVAYNREPSDFEGACSIYVSPRR